jgi:hypothetical protein
MRVIEAPFAAVLRNKAAGRDAARAVDVASNYRGGFHTGDDDDLLQSLTLQLGHPVRWRDNMVAVAGKASGSSRSVREGLSGISLRRWISHANPLSAWRRRSAVQTIGRYGRLMKG